MVRRHLSAHANEQAPLFGVSQHAARLNGQGYHTLIDDVQMNLMGCLSEGLLRGLHIAVTGFSHDVVGLPGQQGRIGSQGILQVGDAWQSLKVNLNSFSCIACLLLSLGHDGDHGFAHKTDTILRQHRAVWG